jgi:hypothetical protein
MFVFYLHVSQLLDFDFANIGINFETRKIY